MNWCKYEKHNHNDNIANALGRLSPRGRALVADLVRRLQYHGGAGSPNATGSGGTATGTSDQHPTAEKITLTWIYAIIGIGCALAVVVIVLIVRTRRP